MSIWSEPVQHEPPIVLELRDSLQKLMRQLDRLEQENMNYQKIVMDTSELILHKMDDLQSRLRAMERILFMETSDGR